MVVGVPGGWWGRWRVGFWGVGSILRVDMAVTVVVVAVDCSVRPPGLRVGCLEVVRRPAVDRTVAEVAEVSGAC